MDKISTIIDKKIKHLIWVLVLNGLFLIVLSILIVWTNFVLELIVGLAVLMVAYVFLYGAYKLWNLKNILDKYLKF